MSLEAELAGALCRLARRGETVGYGELARLLAVPGPGSIATLGRMLEDMMAEDAAEGRPFRAAVCHAKLGNGLPAPGFFETARRLGRYDGPADGAPARAFVTAERAALRALGDDL